jgi:integrase
MAAAKRADIKNLAPHDLRAPVPGSAIWRAENFEQIQLLLGHASVPTTERYLGCKQNLSQAVNGNLGLEGT